ncbi:MAG: sugar ABC transporter permease [Candidatus Roseilinea sp.]|nr:MAG: sugar ABC transporter permease [Candidatus Roseilinea sp.]
MDQAAQPIAPPRAAQPIAAVSAARARRSRRRLIKNIVAHTVLIAFSIAFMVPFYWMIVSSLKTNQQIFTIPIQWLPDPPRWENYSDALTYPNFPFLRFLGNSVFYSISVTIGTVISCAAVGYGFARLRFPFRDALFYITVATLMIPFIVTFIPTYILFKNFGLIGNYTPLILPAFLGNAFFIFMMRQFFLGLPNELADAARVDGAGHFRTFWQVMLPLVKPALMVVAVFTFLGTWNDFLGPLIYLSDNTLYPLSLGLYAFRAQRTTEWALMMAASTITTLPLIVVFFFTQRYFLEGIKLTGLKG